MRKKVFAFYNNLPFLKGSAAAHIIFAEILIGLFLSLATLKIFAEIAEKVLSEETTSLDTTLSHAVYSLRNPFLTDIMYAITFLGADFILVTGAIIACVLTWKHRKREAVLFISLLIMGVLLNVLLKVFFQRARPDLAPLIDLSSTYSFPSGHAMNSFIFFSILSYFVFHFTRNKRLSIVVWVCCSILIFLIGFSRVYLGVHYPSDVLAGFIAGFFVFVTAILLERTMAFLKIKKKK